MNREISLTVKQLDGTPGVIRTPDPLLRSSCLTPHVIEPQCGLALSGTKLAALAARFEHHSEHHFGANLAKRIHLRT